MSTTDWLKTFREAGVFRALDVHLARTLGRIGGEDNPLALLGAAAASRVHGAGHICLQLAQFREQVRDESIEEEGLGWPDPELWEAALAASPLVRSPGDQVLTPLILEDGRLYLERYWGYQRRLAEQVMGRIGRTQGVLDEGALEEALTRLFPPDPAVPLPDKQRMAAEMAVRRGFTVITGGPGTGKTTTIRRLLALLIEDAWSRGEATPRFALMAPTGKAAARMKESIRGSGGGGPSLETSDAVREALPDEASTIHRALGWNPRQPTRFKHNEDNPLDADIVIVDEASMVDMALMTKLLEAVRPDARLVLLGDADQLASVEAGAVLGDLCRELSDGVVELTFTHRFGAQSGVGALSRAIKGADADRTLQLLMHEASDRPGGAPYEELTWLPLKEGASLRELKQQIEKVLRPIVLEETQPYFDALDAGDWAQALAALDRFRVLAAHRAGPLGVRGLNQAIERWLARERRINPKEEHYIGRPILVRKNDREQDLYNGDIGFVAKDSAYDGYGVIFPGGGDVPFRWVSVGRVPPHETVYAMTVHKSQGSQLKHALLALPMEPSRLITRELLYTGVTRAEARVTLMGAEVTLRRGVEEAIERASGMGEALERANED